VAKTVGILEGWRGRVEGMFRDLDLRDVSGILPRGRTILGTSRTNPYKLDGGVYVRRTSR
jgi:6-phosphofructokinase